MQILRLERNCVLNTVSMMVKIFSDLIHCLAGPNNTELQCVRQRLKIFTDCWGSDVQSCGTRVQMYQLYTTMYLLVYRCVSNAERLNEDEIQ